MSQKERVRLVVMQQVKANELTLAQSAEVLCLSYRQTKRIWRRYRLAGDQGLVHGSRGRPGKRAKPAKLKARILARYEERYPDFGPTLAAEYLAAEGMLVDHETLRRWRLAQGKPMMRRRRQRHRQWRERKPCFGAMAQLDGSYHDWFEGRGPRCVLMVMVDDATNRVGAQFFEEETTRASYDMFDDWTQQAGMPQSLYVDRDSIYRCEAVGSVAEQLAGKEPQTQFGRAMRQLGVELILANSPQAKGRVERMNGVLQDRLVKALRLEGISDIESANTFLRRKFLPAFNRRFQLQAASPSDVHQKPPRELNEILSWEVERVVQRDWTVVNGGRWYQLDRQHEALSLAGKKLIVRTLRDGAVQLERRGVKLKWKELSGRPQRRSLRPSQSRPAKDWKPAAAHPWRLGRVGRAGRLTTARPQGARAKARSSPPARSIDNPRLGNYADNNNKGTLSHESLRGHF